MDYGKASAVAVIVTVILLGMTAVYSYFNNKESDWD
jgi:ABC-type sugar transport system permease subunit